MDTSFMFCEHAGHIPDRIADKIAKRHGCCHVNYSDPTGTRRGWFAGPNFGDPFNSQLAAAVRADIERHGGFDTLRIKRREALAR